MRIDAVTSLQVRSAASSPQQTWRAVDEQDEVEQGNRCKVGVVCVCHTNQRSGRDKTDAVGSRYEHTQPGSDEARDEALPRSLHRADDKHGWAAMRARTRRNGSFREVDVAAPATRTAKVKEAVRRTSGDVTLARRASVA